MPGTLEIYRPPGGLAVSDLAPIAWGLSYLEQPRGAVSVVYTRRPLDIKPYHAAVSAYLTIDRILEEIQADPMGGYVVSINGHSIHRGQWNMTAPPPGSLVVIRAVAAGGGSKKKSALEIWGTLMAVSILAATGMTIFPAFAGSFAAAAVSYDYSFLATQYKIRKMKPAGQDTPKLHFNNTLNPYGAFPRVLGRVRWYPPLGCQIVSHSHGATNSIYVMYNLGYGPLAITDLKFGDKDIDDIMSENDYDICDGDGSDSRKIVPPLITNEEHGAELPENTPFGSAIAYRTQANTFEIVVSFDLPDGLTIWNDPTAGEDPGPSGASYLKIPLEVWCREVGVGGGWTRVYSSTQSGVGPNIHRASRQPFEQSHRFDLATAIGNVTGKQYDIRFVRGANQYGEVTTGTEYDTMYIDTIGNIEWVDPFDESHMNGANIASVGIRVDADDAPAIQWDKFNCLTQSKHIHWRSGSWSGVPEVTSNPADMIREVLQGDALNVGAQVVNGDIDLTSFENFADFCVANGYYFNHVFGDQQPVREVVGQIAAVGHGEVVMPDGKYTMIWDHERLDASLHISGRNCWGIQGSRRLPVKLDGISMRYQEKGDDDDYLHTERIAYRSGKSVDTATNVKTAVMIGITDEDQADAQAHYLINLENTRLDTWKVNMDVEQISGTRGDLAYLNADVAMGGISAGRITGVTKSGPNVTDITIDEEVYLTGNNCYLRVRTTIATGEYYDIFLTPTIVNPGAGWYTSLEFSSAIPPSPGPLPKAGDHWTFGTDGAHTTDSIKTIITDVQPGPDLTAIVSLVEEQWAAVSAGSTEASYVPSVTIRPRVEHLAPPEPTIVRYASDETVLLKELDGSYRIALVVQLSYFDLRSAGPIGSVVTEVAKVESVEAQIRLHSDTLTLEKENWRIAGSYIGEPKLITIRDIEQGKTYDLRLRTRSPHNSVSQWTTEEDIEIIGMATPPPDPSGLVFEGNIIRWGYTSTPPLDFAGFEVRRHAGTLASWENALAVHVGVISGTSYPLRETIGGVSTYYVKAVDIQGNYSDNAASLQVSFPVLPPENHELDNPDYWDFALGEGTGSGGIGSAWEGTLSNCYIDIPSGYLVATGSYDEMVYTSNAIIFAADSDDIETIIGTEIEAEGPGWKIEIRVADDPSTLDQWIPFPGEIRHTGTFVVQYRFVGNAGTTQGKLKALKTRLGYRTISEKGLLAYSGVQRSFVLGLPDYRITDIVDLVGTIRDTSGSNAVLQTKQIVWSVGVKRYTVYTKLTDSTTGLHVNGTALWGIHGYRHRSGEPWGSI